MNGQQWEKVKKEQQVIFKEYVLNLNTEWNNTTVNYLEITLKLLDGT